MVKVQTETSANREMSMEEKKPKLEGETKEQESSATGNGKSHEGKIEEKNAQEIKVGDDDDVKTSKLESDIIRQVEYYFGSINLSRDKFLKEQISKDADGWVPLSVLLTFKRLAALTTDPLVIANAMMKSDEGLVEVSEDKTKLRRHPERPLIERTEYFKEAKNRTAYAKGFPLDIQMNDLLEFFKDFEKVLSVSMRKYYDKSDKKYKFKGSVFAEFEKPEQAEEFVKKDQVKFGDRELNRKMQTQYFDDKREENRVKMEKKKQKQEKQKKQEEEENEKFTLPKGTVIGFDGSADLTRELVTEAIAKIDGQWEVAYVDYEKGGEKGFLRFKVENTALKFMDAVPEKKLKVSDDLEIAIRLLEGDEEKSFLDKAQELMKSRRANFKTQGKKRRFQHGHRNEAKKKRSD